MSEVVIQSERVEKCFSVDRSVLRRLMVPFGGRRKILALKGVSFVLKSGQILGVVGPNGAGKTTLLRILADLLEPDGGSVMVCGEEVVGGGCRVRSHIGYVSSDERSFFWRLTGRQNLRFFSRLYGMKGKESRQRTEEMLERFGLSEKADELFRDYSAGTRKKFSLIRGLVHRLGALLLDEVTNSLAPASAAHVKSLVREYVHGCSGRGVVWSTHRLEEIREICDAVLAIDEGDVRFFGCVSDFKNRLMLSHGVAEEREGNNNGLDSSKVVLSGSV